MKALKAFILMQLSQMHGTLRVVITQITWNPAYLLIHLFIRWFYNKTSKLQDPFEIVLLILYELNRIN